MFTDLPGLGAGGSCGPCNGPGIPPRRRCSVRMGTNYYLRRPAKRAAFGRVYVTSETKPDDLHIGKSSAGWCFGLRVYPGEPDKPQNLDEWRAAFAMGTIVDEYGSECTATEMIRCIELRAHHAGGCDWTPATYERNQGEPGPRGLVRHKIGGLCVAHGEGTYDIMVGEFF
jgi:hypothetical protein